MICSSGDLLHVAGKDKMQLYIHNIVWILALTVECQLQHYTGRYEYTKVKCNCTETVGFLLDGGLVLHCIPLCYMIAHNAPIQFNAVA